MAALEFNCALWLLRRNMPDGASFNGTGLLLEAPTPAFRIQRCWIVTPRRQTGVFLVNEACQ